MTITGSPPRDQTFTPAVDVGRFVNDSIRETAERFGGDSATVYEFVCECGDLRCRQFVGLTLAEYDESEAGSVQAH